MAETETLEPPAKTLEERAKLSREELVKLLTTPLDPALDYYDATASIEAMANHIRDLHKLINYLFEAQGIQAASIIQIREMQAAHRGAIEFLADMAGAETDEGPLVGIKKPGLVGPDGKRIS